MNSRTLSTIAIVTFLLLGTLFMGLRYRALQEERTSLEDSRWELTYVVQFKVDSLTGQGEVAQVRLALPFDTPYCEVRLNPPTIPSPNLTRVIRGPYTGTQNTYLELTTKQASPDQPYLATANFELRLSPRRQARGLPAFESLTPAAENSFLQEEKEIPTLRAEVRQVAQSAQNETETRAEQMQWIFQYCADIDSKPDSAGDSVVDAITRGVGTPLARARTMVALCRALRIPARLVTGFIIRQGDNVQPHVWVEVFHQQTWLPFDPTNGYSFSLPMNYLPVRRNFDQIYSLVNVTEPLIRFSIRRLRPDDRVLTGEIEHPVQILDLTRLPVSMHTVMSLLLLLPFGALITSVMRNVVGVQTFGTFAPALLAMSFIYADWETGLAILLVVVTAGLMGRLWLERLRLLMVPRLSIILTLVILCVVFSVSSFDFMGVTPSPQAVLLPMVILTILIERFHVTMEEDGLMFAIQLAVGTVVVAMLCYLVLRWNEVGAWVLQYPETHFFTIAAFILLGRYAGYRLTELWRFRDLVEPREPQR
jgi:transglutaminase-like putative cysteine protease